MLDIQRVIEAFGLDGSMVKGNFTHSEQRPLFKDDDGKPPRMMFRYISFVGMLLCLSGHTRPDIDFAVNFCAQYMFCPNRYH